MGITLLRFLKKRIFFFVLLLGVSGRVTAQSPGDIAFVGINGNAEEFAIVVLADMPSNTTVFFTDAEWDGSAFQPGGGDIRWETGANSIAPGTVVTFRHVNSEEASVSAGSLSGSNLDLLSPSITLFSYVGPEIGTPSGFLAAISNREEQNYSGTGLTVGKEVVLLNSTAMRAAYRGARGGEGAAAYLQLIGDAENNWREAGSQTEYFPLDTMPFTFRDPAGNTARGPHTFLVPVDGEEGWRGLSTPTQNTSFEQLMGDIWIRGMNGTADPGSGATILSWEEQAGGSFIYPESTADRLEPGRGYFVYISEDDDPNTAGVQGGFPKTISSDEALHDRIVDVPVSATDADESGRIDGMEGFNLLGNPFDKELSVEAVKEELARISTNINDHLYVWNPEMGDGNGGFELLTDADVIAPTQPFWVRYLDKGIKGVARFDRSSLAGEAGQDQYGVMNDPSGSFELKLGAGEWFDTYRIELREGGEVGEDKLDGYKIFSLKPHSINLFSTVGSGNMLARNVLPDRLEQEIEVPLLFSTAGRADLTFSWERPDDLPRHWDLVLKDQQQDQEINLRTANSYYFELEEAVTAIEQAAVPEEQMLLNTQNESTSVERFFLTIRPSGSAEENVTEELPESIRLKPNYPNPFTNTTTIPYELDEATEVTLTIWNMIGQKVATLIDGQLKSAGAHDEDPDINWNATNMPSGMYIARLEAGGEVFTRKMTLIK